MDKAKSSFKSNNIVLEENKLGLNENDRNNNNTIKIPEIIKNTNINQTDKNVFDIFDKDFIKVSFVIVKFRKIYQILRVN